MRLYSVAIASLVAEAPIKWTDNLIAHYPLPEVRSRSRGVSRSVSWAGVVRIVLIRTLHRQVGCALRDAVALSAGLLRSSDGALALGERLRLAIDRDALERDVHARLAEVLESAPRPRRGRPVRRGDGQRSSQG